METTFNNIFSKAVENAVSIKRAEEERYQKALNDFLEEMRHIKKNLESAFIGTPIRVEMGMFGVREPQYTSIYIRWGKGRIGTITSNNSIWRDKGWNNYEDKDIRLNGVSMTYEELFTRVAEEYAKSL